MDEKLHSLLRHRPTILILEDLPEDPKILAMPSQKGNRYGWGFCETYRGDGWIARTSGDLLGPDHDPYRIFDVNLYMTLAAYEAILRELAYPKWYSKHNLPRADRPAGWSMPDQPDDLVGWMIESGNLPANWPNPRTSVEV